jgi:hypothetical protein
MKNYKKGDILVGKDRSFKGAYHPIIFISGSNEAPLAVILTHSKNFSCNIGLSGTYGPNTSYFVAHLIEKMSKWGPYRKVSKLTNKDLNLIQTHISGLVPITWGQYENHMKNGCTKHG